MDATEGDPYYRYPFYPPWALEHKCPAKMSKLQQQQSSTHVTRHRDSRASPAPWKCYGTCSSPNSSKQHPNYCLTDCCTETTELPIVYQHSFCALVSMEVEDDSGDTIGCNMWQNSDPIAGTKWTVVVEKGTSCRAICYNLNHPTNLHFAHHIFKNTYKDYVQSAENVFLCFLNGIMLAGKGSGLCADSGSDCSGYCQLEYTTESNWVISAAGTLQPTCNVSCMHVDSGGPKRNGVSEFQTGTEWREWDSYPECFISEIGINIPVSTPPGQFVKPSCQMTIIDNHYNISVTGKQTRCAATCTCIDYNNEPYNMLGCIPFPDWL